MGPASDGGVGSGDVPETDSVLIDTPVPRAMTSDSSGPGPVRFRTGSGSTDEVLDAAFATLAEIGVPIPEDDEAVEREFVRSFVAAVSPGDVVWDVGAHGGLYSICTRFLADPSRLVGIEPNPHVYPGLERVFAALPGSNTSLNLALGDADGTRRMAVDPDGGTASTFPDTDSIASEEDAYETVTVRTRRAETLVATDGVPAPDVVKIDVEGAEDRVLDGLEPLVDDVRCLFVEAHHMDRRFEELDDRLSRLPFEVTVLSTRHQTETCYQEFLRLARPE